MNQQITAHWVLFLVILACFVLWLVTRFIKPVIVPFHHTRVDKVNLTAFVLMMAFAIVFLFMTRAYWFEIFHYGEHKIMTAIQESRQPGESSGSPENTGTNSNDTASSKAANVKTKHRTSPRVSHSGPGFHQEIQINTFGPDTKIYNYNDHTTHDESADDVDDDSVKHSKTTHRRHEAKDKGKKVDAEVAAPAKTNAVAELKKIEIPASQPAITSVVAQATATLQSTNIAPPSADTSTSTVTRAEANVSTNVSGTNSEAIPSALPTLKTNVDVSGVSYDNQPIKQELVPFIFTASVTTNLSMCELSLNVNYAIKGLKKNVNAGLQKVGLKNQADVDKFKKERIYVYQLTASIDHTSDNQERRRAVDGLEQLLREFVPSKIGALRDDFDFSVSQDTDMQTQFAKVFDSFLIENHEGKCPGTTTRDWSEWIGQNEIKIITKSFALPNPTTH